MSGRGAVEELVLHEVGSQSFGVREVVRIDAQLARGHHIGLVVVDEEHIRGGQVVGVEQEAKDGRIGLDHADAPRDDDAPEAPQPVEARLGVREHLRGPVAEGVERHAAVVELVALDEATIKYSTVQNWYPGDRNGVGGIYNFVTKRGLCKGRRSKITWTQVETGSAVTWKYPSCILQGDDSVGEFYSVAVTNNFQQADTGTKMIHNGSGSRSTIISKGISAGKSSNTYRGLVRVAANAENVRNFTQCDSLLLRDTYGAHTVPYIEVKTPTAQIEHEATTSKISEDELFYAMQRGLGQEEAVALIVNGFAKEVLQQLPMEFAVEAQKLLGISLEGSVG